MNNNDEIKQKPNIPEEQADVTVGREDGELVPSDLHIEEPKLTEEEKQNRIRAMIPDVFYLQPTLKKKDKVGCFQVLLVLFIIVIIATMLLLFKGLNTLNGVLSDFRIAVEPVILSEAEKAGLKLCFDRYNSVLQKAKETGEPAEFELTLNGAQLNYLLNLIPVEVETGRICAARIYPVDDAAEVYLSIVFNKKKYINVVLKGRPLIKNYNFLMEIDTISVGGTQNADNWKERIIRRINKELEVIPGTMGLSFRVKEMTIKDSQIFLKLSVKSKSK